MMTCPSATTRIVAATSAFLLSVTGDHRRIKVKRDKLHLRKFGKQPTIHVHLDTLVGQHVKTIEKTNNRFELRSA